MSYCVNCGVELAASEKCCPLCHTEVVNPNDPWKEPSVRPYPPRLELIMKHVDRRYLALLISCAMIIPVLVTLLCDLLGTGRVTWSAYVLAAVVLLMVWVVLPLWFKRYHRLTFIGLDGLAALVFLSAVELAGGGDWFLPLALPITVEFFAFLLLLGFLFRQSWGRQLFTRIAMVFAAIGFYCILVEIAIDLYCYGQVLMRWSLYVLIPCLVLAFSTQIIDRKQKFKDEIIKRMFY